MQMPYIKKNTNGKRHHVFRRRNGYKSLKLGPISLLQVDVLSQRYATLSMPRKQIGQGIET